MSLGLRKKSSTHMQLWGLRASSGRDLALQDVPLTEMGHRSICSGRLDKINSHGVEWRELLAIWVFGKWLKNIKYESKALNGDHDFD